MCDTSFEFTGFAVERLNGTLELLSSQKSDMQLSVIFWIAVLIFGSSGSFNIKTDSFSISNFISLS